MNKIIKLPEIRVFIFHGLSAGHSATLLRWAKPREGRVRCVVLVDGDITPINYPRDIMRVLPINTRQENAA